MPRSSAQVEQRIAAGKKERAAGKFAEAIEQFSRAARMAHESGDFSLEAKALGSTAACQIRLFRYRAALDSSEASRHLALRAKDDSVAGVASINIAIIYAQLGDFSHAENEARESVRLLQQSSRKDFFIRALLNHGSIQVDRGESRAGIELYRKAIKIAQQAKLPDQEAIAWDDLGRSYLDLGELPEADAALARARDLHVAAHDQDSLATTTVNRAELEYKRNNLIRALKLLDVAFAAHSSALATTPQYEPAHLRGQILEALGRKSQALAQFQTAVELATRWRRGALPGDATSIRTSAHLHEVFEDYISLAAQLSLERHDSALARQAWEVLAESRAASLREQMSVALGRDGQLPPEYFELLSKLQSAEARFTGSQNAIDEATFRQIRLQLSSLENQIGMQTENSAQLQESIFHKKSLRNIQLRLTMSDLLLSFGLGRVKSFLWTIARDRVNVYELPAETEIGKQARAFSHAVRYERDASKPGRCLSEQLFGNLELGAWHKPNWLIAGNGALLNGIPFSALPEIPVSAVPAPLITGHTLRFLPSELLLLQSSGTVTPQQERRFLGVGDPIYNLADSRRVRSPVSSNAKDIDAPFALARLPGSAGEIRIAAKLSGMTDVQLLEGSNASSNTLRAALLKTPQVLHFAVHVVSPKSRPEEAALALSLTAENIPELLTREAIAGYRVPGGLVVLSGCSSQQGETLPSAGLIGLSRAWLLAGASAVIVSAWPTPDDSGRFFSSFYSHFQLLTSTSGSLAKRAAMALQQAQGEMRQSKGYASSPSFWAAYSVISKE
ncbi:MAG: CHAT domain-containing protein [Bryobacteraceae bacterium]